MNILRVTLLTIALVTSTIGLVELAKLFNFGATSKAEVSTQIHHQSKQKIDAYQNWRVIESRKVVRAHIGDIGEGAYKKLVRSLRGVDQNKTLVLDIKSRGGLTSETIRIVEYIKKWKGKTVAVVSRYAFSGGAVIFSAADEQIIRNGAKILYHLSGYSLTPGYRCVIPLSEFGQGWIMKLLDEKVGKFITPEEALTIVQGHDVIISGYQWNLRAKSKIKYNNHVIKIFNKVLNSGKPTDRECK